MTRQAKVAVMVYRAMALYLELYPAERVRLRKLVGSTIVKKSRSVGCSWAGAKGAAR